MAASTSGLAPIRQTSLLSLPRELRLQIYQQVISLDLNHVQVDDGRLSQMHFRASDRKLHQMLYGDKAPETIKKSGLSIPWLNLMLACKTTAIELRAFMKEPSFLAVPTNRTYTLAVEACNQGRHLGKALWRYLPCAPAQADVLEVYYNASRGLRVWGDGGVFHITTELYQTLNHLLHRGPQLFDTTVNLLRPMHIKELRIIVEPGKEGEEGREADIWFSEKELDPDTVALSLGSIVGPINNTGVLKGHVDRIQIRSPRQTLHWAPEEVDGSGIPEEWSGYGFEWGVS